ncbi:helix-turn-helix transcriptional regulator [Nostoc sp. CENA67]|uniref:Helix-turn-helix transcriptional regulator n=1 Tax=Amazonocrinis nigriterrae CENA67 TaxID=2794033 RepID=A0A8J7LAT8_9NOST|nr:helix-turn-helix transcriptional regulator [Amazonocrinis nigriterrae]MBH8565225.1 helix-turn-helix transcriptional regulator [Amazonocrinis nigriterrae CENA67]
MGRAGKALRQVLEVHNISQNQLAVAMDIGRSSINRWVNENRDPSAEAVIEIIEALEKINSAAARDFLLLYLGRFILNDNQT